MNEQSDDFRSVMASVDREGRRNWLYVHMVHGVWRARRRVVAWGLLLAYLALPFLHIGGNRVLFIDIPNRQYHILGQVFWPQDAFYLLLAILLFLVGTLLLVSLLGRVFCGWLCPHNVTLEFLFRPLEQLLEGPAHRRRRQDQRDWSGQLIARKVIKWALYLIVAWALANTAVALFLPTATYLNDFLLGILVDPRLHPSAFLFWAITAGVLLFNFAWFREQTCTIACPYGRMQAVMLDSDTLAVSYDHERGEPRGKRRGKDIAVAGDCIDCGMCQQVCPTGIDIRNGNQLECIHCAACIDACDSVMAKIGRPIGLIRYSSENALAGGRLQLLRLRQLWYGLVFAGLLTLTVIMVSLRQGLQVERLRDRGVAVAATNAAGENVIRKNYQLALVNKTGKNKTVQMSLDPSVPGRLVSQYSSLELPASAREVVTVFVEIPQHRFIGKRMEVDVLVTDSDGEPLRIPLRLRKP
ncbi:MAG: cytochrome c oxidase accessory protein CcoG [Planctomycetota bacterium]